MSAGYLSKCARKVRYETRQLALEARAAMVSGGRATNSQMSTYRCDQCGGFHNGRSGRAGRYQKGRGGR